MTLPLFDSTALLSSAIPKSLRPYQQRAIVNVRALTLLDKKRILCVGPTGCGKMFVIANIIKTASLPVLFVAHRKEIIDQCASQLAQHGITNVGVIRANDCRYSPSSSTQVASIATLARRDKPFAGQKIILIIDEAHRAASDTYQDLLSHYPDAIVLGFTATPMRLDGRPLGGELFEELVQIATYDELLKKKEWLVAPDVFAGRERLDLTSVRKIGGDFDEGQLAMAMHTDKLEGQIVEHWLARSHLHPVFLNGERLHAKFTEGERRRSILFAVNIEHSMSLAARFEKAGVRVAHLDGSTPETQREAMLHDLVSGQLEIITNCLVAVEGLDVPEVKCIVHARPTWSMTLWRQTIGRSMRPWNDVVPILLDHAGNFDRLGCPFEDLVWSLKDKPRRVSRDSMKLCHSCFAYVEASRTLCPFCGAEFRREDRRQPTESNEVLQQRSTDPEELRWAFFWRQVVTAKSKGFKPGFASAIFKEHYGVWPPRHWSEQIKSDFEKDALWQNLLERRLERKKMYEERERQEEQALAEAAAAEAQAAEEYFTEKSQEETALEKTIEAIDAPYDDFLSWYEQQ